MLGVLDHFTAFYSREGLRFDQDRLVWLNRENKVVSITSNGKDFNEESIFVKMIEVLKIIWDQFCDSVYRCLRYETDTYFLPQEQLVIRLYNKVYKDFKERVERLTQHELYFGRISPPGRPGPIDREERAYQAVHEAARFIWTTKNFPFVILSPDYKYARIQPSIEFLLNRRPL